MTDPQSPLLEVHGLTVAFSSPRGALQVVRGVEFALTQGEVLGLVGESGSGKTMTLKAILRLLEKSAVVGGSILWRGEDILGVSEQRMRKIRGAEIAMIFQEPMTALNPVLTIGAQIDEVLCAHTTLDRGQRRRRAKELLEQTGIPSPAARLGQFPHEFSGGMRQRAMIAIALAGEPKLLLADEPTTALDVTIQDQILNLLNDLVAERHMAMILVTHDLGVVAETCDRVCVMYAGKVMETGAVGDVFLRPRHAYTSALLSSVAHDGPVHRPLTTIPGQPALLGEVQEGCPFAPRCRYVMDECRAGEVFARNFGGGHTAACLAADRLPALDATP